MAHQFDNSDLRRIIIEAIAQNIVLSPLPSLDTTTIRRNPHPAPSLQSVVSWARVAARQLNFGTEVRLAAPWRVLEVCLVACQ
jgi:hypothetical protein